MHYIWPKVCTASGSSCKSRQSGLLHQDVWSLKKNKLRRVDGKGRLDPAERGNPLWDHICPRVDFNNAASSPMANRISGVMVTRPAFYSVTVGAVVGVERVKTSSMTPWNQQNSSEECQRTGLTTLTSSWVILPLDLSPMDDLASPPRYSLRMELQIASTARPPFTCTYITSHSSIFLLVQELPSLTVACYTRRKNETRLCSNCSGVVLSGELGACLIL